MSKKAAKKEKYNESKSLSEEQEKLVEHFRTYDKDEGLKGDWREDTTVDTAIRVLRERGEELTEARKKIKKLEIFNDIIRKELLIREYGSFAEL